MINRLEYILDYGIQVDPLFDMVDELEAENQRLKKIEAAAVEYVRDSYRPEPKYDAERFDKLVATLPNGVRLEEDDE